MKVLALIIFIALVARSYQAAVVGTTCPVPTNAKEWDLNPEATTVDVYWMYGNETTCNSRQTCNDTYNVIDSTDSPDVTLVDDHMRVQLKPVELQPGNHLRFLPNGVGTSFPFIYHVDEASFLSCQSEGWAPIWNQGPYLNGGFLRAGNNYFVVEDHGTIQCSNGLRLNVTVKTDDCHQPNTRKVCSGRGRCVTYTGQPSYSCQCCGHYRGQQCEIYDVCLGNPCFHGGECIHTNATEAANATHFDQYHCKCPLGYHGEHCQINATDVCDTITCHNNATCTGNATDFECACPDGYTGSHCEVEVNECESSPCRHGACQDLLNGFECRCLPGFRGRMCEERIPKMIPNACMHGGYGENKTLEGGKFEWQCHCPPLWTGRICNETTDPCLSNPCSHGYCEVLSSSYKCNCQPGYTGIHCEVEINECHDNPCHYGGRCKDLLNAYNCLCLPTHAGQNCQYTIDIFYPVLDDIEAVDRATRLSDENKSLYIMAAVLSVAIIMIISLVAVLVVCYCRRSDEPRLVCGMRVPSLYRSQSSDGNLSFSVESNNTLDCPLTSDAFFKGESSNGGVTNPAFQNQVV